MRTVPIILTATELAAELGVSRQAVNKAAREGRLPVADTDHRGRRLFDLRECVTAAANRTAA